MKPTNPFAPTFGAPPPMLAGREDILCELTDALDAGPTHPSYTSLLLGSRGSGKTVVLSELRLRAEAKGWLSVSAAAVSTGLLDRVAHLAMEHLNRWPGWLLTEVASRLASAGIGVGPDYDPNDDLSRRIGNVLSALGLCLGSQSRGLLLTVDELHAGAADELRLLGTAVQEVTRVAQLPVAFVGAGLKALETTLLQDSSVTFLQRCARYEIGYLDRASAWQALEQPVVDIGGRVTPDALEEAVSASQGYPFMVQLVGFHTWAAAADPSTTIALDDVHVGAEHARRQVGRLIVAPIWKGLSPAERRFLVAMAHDDDESRLADIANRMEVSSGYVGVYRGRLLTSGLLEQPRRGVVTFAIEAARNWIRQLDDYPLLCETLKLEPQTQIGFAKP